MNVLVIDIGDSSIKLLATGQTEPRKVASDASLTPQRMVNEVKSTTADWTYDAVAIGYPGPVANNRPLTEPWNLGRGWVGFNFEQAFGRPIRIVNDAALQALGNYRGGKMLYLGLGTGLGSCMVINGIVEPMELGHLPYQAARFEDYVGIHGLNRLGKKVWQETVKDVVKCLVAALEPDDVVLGGGNVKTLDTLPPGCREGNNANAFAGGFRLFGGNQP